MQIEWLEKLSNRKSLNQLIFTMISKPTIVFSTTSSLFTHDGYQDMAIVGTH